MLENDTFIILEVLLNDEAMISKNLHKVIDSHCKIAGRDLICKFVNDVTVTKTFCLHFQRQAVLSTLFWARNWNSVFSDTKFTK